MPVGPVHYLHRVCGAAGLGERFRNECTPHEWPHRKRHNARVLAFAFAIISIAVEIARIPVGYTSIRRTRQRTACTMNATGRACVRARMRALQIKAVRTLICVGKYALALATRADTVRARDTRTCERGACPFYCPELIFKCMRCAGVCVYLCPRAANISLAVAACASSYARKSVSPFHSARARGRVCVFLHAHPAHNFLSNACA